MADTLDLGALIASVDINTIQFDKKYTRSVQQFEKLGEAAAASAGGVDKLDVALAELAASSGKVAASTTRNVKATTEESAAATRAAAAEERRAKAVADLGVMMGRLSGESTTIQRLTLRQVAAQEALNKAQETGSATAGQLASRNATLIGSTERLAAAQREATVAASSTKSGFAGLLKTGAELGLVFGGIEVAKKAIEFVGAGKELTTALNGIQAAAHATNAQMMGVRTQSIALGKDMSIPAATAVDAADAIQDLVRAGMTLPRAMAAARPALLLASAAQVSTADAARYLGDTLDDFGLKASEATHVANSLAGAATSAGGGLTDMFTALSYAGPYARAAGVDVDSVVASIAELAKSGVQGSRAGTGIARMLQSLASVTPRSAAALKDLGVQAFDAQGRFKGLPSLYGQLHDAQQRFGVDTERFTKDVTQAFGARAATAVAIFAHRGIDGYNQFADRVKSGDVQKYADLMNRGVAASLAALKKEFTATGIDLYQKMEPALNSIVAAIAVGLPAALEIGKAALAPYVAVWHTLGAALGPIASAMGALLHAAEPLAPVLKVAAVAALSLYTGFKLFALARLAISGITSAVGRIGPKIIEAGVAARTAGVELSTMGAASSLALGGIGIALGVATYARSKHAESVAKNKAEVDSLTEALQADAGALGNNTRAAIANSLQQSGALDAARTLGLNLKYVTDAAISGTPAINALLMSASRYAAGAYGAAGGTEKQTAAYRKLQTALTGTSGNLDKAVQGYKNVKAATDPATGATHELSQAQIDASKAADAQKQAVAALDTALQGLAQTQLAAATSEDAFKEGLLGVKSAVKDNGKSLSQNTKGGLANRDMLLQLLGQTVALANAKKKDIERTHSSATAIKVSTAALADNVKQLITTATNAGLSRSAVHALVAQMGLTPKQIATIFNTDTSKANSNLATTKGYAAALNAYINGSNPKLTVNAADALRQLREIQNQLNNLPKFKTIGVHVGVTGGHTLPASAAGSGSWTKDGKLPPNTVSTAGERGWELVTTDSQGRATITSHPQSVAMTGMPDRLPGYAGGTGGNVQSIVATLNQLGLGRKAIAAFLGNFKIESGWNNKAYNPGENAHGFAQWEGGRWTALQKFAAAHHENATSTAAELGYLRKELTGGYSGVLNRLKQGGSVSQLAQVVQSKFEGSTPDSLGARQAAAQAAFKALSSGKIPVGGGTGDAGAGLSKEERRRALADAQRRHKDPLTPDQRRSALEAAQKSEAARLTKEVGRLADTVNATKDLNHSLGQGAAAVGKAEKSLNKYAREAGFSRKQMAGLVDAEGRLLNVEKNRTAATKELSAMRATRASTIGTLSGGLDVTKFGSVRDLVQGLQGATSTDRTYGSEVKQLRGKIPAGLLKSLIAGGQSATLETLAAGSAKDRQLASKAYIAYTGSLSAAGDAAVGAQYGKSITQQGRHVADVIASERRLVMSLDRLTAKDAKQVLEIRLDGDKVGEHVLHSKAAQRLLHEISDIVHPGH